MQTDACHPNVGFYYGDRTASPEEPWDVHGSHVLWAANLGTRFTNRHGGGVRESAFCLYWEILWTEEPGGLQSMGLQKIQT